MIDAAQARTLSGLTVTEHLAVIEKYIIKDAEQGNRSCIIRDQPYATWLYETSNKNKLVDQVITELKKLGYQVELYYFASQFVDMGLKITW